MSSLITIGDTIPNLEVETTQGKFNLHDFIGDNWTIIFSYPCDFTPASTTEVGKVAEYISEFEARGVKLIGLACCKVDSHNCWINDVESYKGCKVTFPIIADPSRDVIKQLNMVDPEEKDSKGLQLPSRALHIVGPCKKIKLSILYPATTGRNFDEVLRVVDSLQTVDNHKVTTSENWKRGDPVFIAPNVSNEEAKKLFPQGYKTVEVPSKKEYMRITNV